MTKPTFEKHIKDLEQIVRELESGELPIEKALKKFEDGMKLTKLCSEMLDEMEKRITMLLKAPDGSVREMDFKIQEPENV